MSYSPGPWTADLGTLSITSFAGQTIFRHGLVYGRPSDEEMGNVLLAAAAPELFEAAIVVLEDGGFCGGGDDPEGRIWCDLVKPLEAAVKKVRGW